MQLHARRLESPESEPTKPVLRTATVMGYGQNLETIRLWPVDDGQRKTLKGDATNIWLQLNPPGLWRLANQSGQGLKLADQYPTQSKNLRFVVTD